MHANATATTSPRGRSLVLLIAGALLATGCGHIGLDADASKMPAFTLVEVARAAAAAVRGEGDAQRPAVVPGEFVGTFMCGMNDEPASVLAQTSADGALRLTWISSASLEVCNASFTFRVRDERVHLHGHPAEACAGSGEIVPSEPVADDFAIRRADRDRLVFGSPGFELVCQRGAR